MKNISKYIAALALMFSWAGCQDTTVSTPTLDVYTDKATYKIGEEVKFRFVGDADYVTIFTGVDNYSGGNIAGSFKGSRYIYRERISQAGKSILSFNTQKGNVNTLSNAQLKLLISTDFNGGITIDDINKATWTDITGKANWPTAATAAGTNIASGQIDLSQWNGQMIYVALKYTAGGGADQFGWTLSSFTLNNTVPTDATTFVIWNNGSAPKFGTTTNIMGTDGYTMYNWTIGTSLICKGGSGTGTQPLESWLVSSPVDPAKVDPDYGTVIKSYSQVVPEFYQFQYWKKGTFTATVVARNASENGERVTTKDIELTIE